MARERDGEKARGREGRESEGDKGEGKIDGEGEMEREGRERERGGSQRQIVGLQKYGLHRGLNPPHLGPKKTTD